MGLHQISEYQKIKQNYEENYNKNENIDHKRTYEMEIKSIMVHSDYVCRKPNNDIGKYFIFTIIFLYFFLEFFISHLRTSFIHFKDYLAVDFYLNCLYLFYSLISIHVRACVCV